MRTDSQIGMEPDVNANVNADEKTGSLLSRWSTPAGVALAVLGGLVPYGWMTSVFRAAGFGFVGINIWSGSRRQRRSAVAALGCIIAFHLLWAMPREFLAAEISRIPLAPIAAVEATVVPGGESITVHPAGAQSAAGMTSCFYDRGLMVAAAHRCGLPEPPWELCLTCFAAGLVDGVPTLEADTPDGIVISGVKCPDEDRRPLPIGGLVDVHVDQTATLVVSGGADQEAAMLGYVLRDEVQFLVVRMASGGTGIGAGMSGTPVVQDGKLIAFLAGRPWWDLSGRLGLARLAADVYAATLADR